MPNLLDVINAKREWLKAFPYRIEIRNGIEPYQEIRSWLKAEMGDSIRWNYDSPPVVVGRAWTFDSNSENLYVTKLEIYLTDQSDCVFIKLMTP